MNETTFQVMNPLANTIAEAESIVGQLISVAEELDYCIADERAWFSRHKEAESTYEMAENEIISEAITMAAKAKEGPLAGIPVSGKGYDIVLDKLKNDARKGPLSQQWASFTNVCKSYEAAKTDLMKAEARFNVLRKVADVKANVLRASTVYHE